MKLKVQLRNNTVTLSGYVNAVGRDSRVLNENGKKFIEQIVPGTFSRALKCEHDIFF